MRLWRTVITSALCVGSAFLGAAAPAEAAPLQVLPATVAMPFTTTPTPTLAGGLAPGQVVTATAGTWVPTPSKLTYSFFKVASNGYRVLVQAGTSNRYVVRNGDNTYRIAVTVTAERAGYATASRPSVASLHVLLPQQRQLVPAFGGDWHDMYLAGPGSHAAPVRLPRLATHAYVEYRCDAATPGSVRLYSETQMTRATPAASLTLATEAGTYGSMLWLDYPTFGRLAAVQVRCQGRWSLTVRPAASAPPVYADAGGFGSKAFVYTGPGAQRFFALPLSASPEAVTVRMGTSMLAPRSVISLTAQTPMVWAQVPAGPTFMQSQGGSWGMSLPPA